MLRGHLRSLWFVLALLLAAGAPLATAAQDASPAASPAAGAPPVVASGLTNPRGFTWAPDGTLYVALAGNGGTSPAVGDPLPHRADPRLAAVRQQLSPGSALRGVPSRSPPDCRQVST